MKVLIVNTLFPPHRIGGAEKSVALLADGLARAGDSVAVATLDDIAAPTVERLANDVRVHRLPMDNVYWPYGSADEARPKAARLHWHARNSWNRRAAERLGAVIDAEQPDLVHCNVLTGFSPAVWPEVKRRGLPLVQTLRDYALMCTRAALFKNGHQCEARHLECRALTWPAKRASASVDQLVSNSNYVIAEHQRAGYFPGVPKRRIFNVVEIPAEPRVAASSSGEPLIFGYIGRIEAEKGIDVVLDACDRLDRPDWRLRIAGVGHSEYVDELKRRHPDPRIEWLGFADSASFYRSVDVTLISSVWPEPLPRTLIETLGNGMGAICSDAGGIPEIADLGRRSITYPATDADALAAAMRQAIDGADDWRSGGLKDPDALDAFSEAQVVAAYRQVYADAMAAVRGRR